MTKTETGGGFRRLSTGRGHRYVDTDGTPIPGVTTLIGNGVPKPALVGWAAKTAAEYAVDHIDTVAALDREAAVELVKLAPNRQRNALANRGNEVHALAARLAAGEEVQVPPELAGLIDAYLAFMTDWQPEYLAVEAPILNRRWRYAGTFDMVCRLRGELVSLVDIKTGASGIWPETCLQLAAYRHAELMLLDGQERPMLATEAGHALWLKDDGTYELLPVASGPDIFAIFLHACFVAEFQRRDNALLIGSVVQLPEVAAS